MNKTLLLSVMAVVLSACNQAYKEVTPVTIGSTPGVMTTADVRTILERQNSEGPIICSEPPPDVAKAFSYATSVAGSGGISNGANGKLNISASGAESLAQLAGRVPGLLAMRDLLFRACEAEANHAIGKLTYALIVSQYANLLATVITADAVNDPSQGAKPITLQGENLTQATPAAPPAPKPDPNAKPKAAGAGADVSATPGIVPVSFTPGLPQPGISLAKAVAKPAPPAAKKLPPADKPSATDDSPKTTLSGASAALMQIHENFLNHANAIAPLLVACVTQYDPSLNRDGIVKENEVLTHEFCGKFLTSLYTADIDAIKTGAMAKAKTAPHAP
ncbi:hypothetical protein [Lichenicoccus sp.]|uniref:hypothetical protein n=1 Tax=Lichenicoccus sp. TaxID=2781899 RepID=UPI003D0A4DCC